MRTLFQVCVLVFAFGTLAHAEPFERGPMIDKGQYIGGGILGTIIGFGTGHIVQDRWQTMGWIFTAGEAAGFSLMIASWVLDPSKGRDILGIFGYLVFAGFHVWEIVDIWGEPLWDHRIIKDTPQRASADNGLQLSGAVAGLRFAW